MKKALLPRFFLAVWVSFVMAANANAITMSGGGWQGRDLTAQEIGVFSGEFRNIGEFIVPAEDPVLAGPDAIEFYAHIINFSGTVGFQKPPVPSLPLNAVENIVLEGGASLFSGDSVVKADGDISVTGTCPIAFGNVSSISNGSGISAVTIDPGLGGSSILLGVGSRYLDSSIMSVIGHYPVHRRHIISQTSMPPLPEPATMLLIAIGLYGLAGASIGRKLREQRI